MVWGGAINFRKPHLTIGCKDRHLEMRSSGSLRGYKEQMGAISSFSGAKARSIARVIARKRNYTLHFEMR